MALRRILVLLAATVMLTATAASVRAAEPAGTPSPSPAASMPSWLDHLLMPVDEEPTGASWSVPLPAGPLSIEEQNMLSRSSEGLFPRFRLDGTIELDLQGRFQEFSVVRVGSDGRIVHNCVSDAASLHELFALPVAPAPAMEDR